MLNIQSEFYRWFLDLVIRWLLSQQFSGNVRVDEETVLAVLPHGQLTQRGAGAYFTPKQANKLPRRGERLNIITVGGLDYIGAVGDTRKRSPALRPMSRGGGVPVLPLPDQPVMSLALPEHAPNSYLLVEEGQAEPTTESSATWDASAQTWRYMLPKMTLQALASTLFDPEGEPLTWRHRHLVGKSVLPKRPLMLGYDPGYFATLHSALRKSYWEACNIFEVYDGKFNETNVPVPYDGTYLYVQQPPTPTTFGVSLIQSGPNVYTEGDADPETGQKPLIPEPLYPAEIDFGTVALESGVEPFFPKKTEFRPFNDFPSEPSDYSAEPFTYDRTVFAFTTQTKQELDPVYTEFTVPAAGLGKIQQQPWVHQFTLQTLMQEATATPSNQVLTTPALTDTIHIFQANMQVPDQGFIYLPKNSVIYWGIRLHLESPENQEAIAALANEGFNPWAIVTDVSWSYETWEYEYEGTPPLIPPPDYQPVFYTGKASGLIWTFQLDRNVLVSEHSYYDAAQLVPKLQFTSVPMDGNDPDDPRPSDRIWYDMNFGGWQDALYRFDERYSGAATGAWAQSAHTRNGGLEVRYGPVAVVDLVKEIRCDRFVSDSFGSGWTGVHNGDFTRTVQTVNVNGAVAEPGEAVKGELRLDTVNDVTKFERPFIAETVAIADMPDLSTPVMEQFGDFTATYDYYLQGNRSPLEDTDQAVYGVYIIQNGKVAQKINPDDPPPETLPRWQPEPTEEGEEPVYPFVLTPQHQREIAFTHPYLYGYRYPDSEPTEGEYGLLPNPFSGITAGKWCGLEWEARWYAADAFLGMFFDDEGNPVEKLVGVVIYQNPTSLEHRVLVSVDRASVKSEGWSLWDFFPGSVPQEGEPSLRFQDGTVWPSIDARPLAQTYNFCHPDWPFKDVALLSPFRARLKNPLVDKVGKMFVQSAADCPVVLYLESHPNYERD